MKLVYDEVACSTLSRFPWLIQKRIIEKLEAASSNPYHFFERLVGRSEHKLRVGDYRAIALITQDVIYVLLIDHRRRVYKRLKT